jgi:hypothetical protein
VAACTPGNQIPDRRHATVATAHHAVQHGIGYNAPTDAAFLAKRLK